MLTPVIILIAVALLVGFIWSILYQKKRSKQGWNDLVEIRKTILTATSKQQLEDAIEILNLLLKSTYDDQYLAGACIVLRMLIEDKIKIDYPLSK